MAVHPKLQVAAVVAFYMVAALVMVFVNKAVLVATPELPLFFLLVQLIVAVALLHLCRLVLPVRFADVPNPQTITKELAAKLMPVITSGMLVIVFNALCLRAVEPTFFQIARGMVLPFTIFASAMHLRSYPSARVLVASVIVTAGFLIGVAPDPSLPPRATPSIKGLVYGVFGSVFIAAHAVFSKSALGVVQGSPIKLAYWSNLGGTCLLVPAVFVSGEARLIYDSLMTDYEPIEWRVFVIGSAVTGVFGFLLSVASLISIKVTSPVTHMFSSAARSVVQTLLGVWLFKDVVNTPRAASISTILAGTLYFTYVKSTETKPKQEPVLPVVTKYEDVSSDEEEKS